MAKTVALLGGSFNPPHVAHQMLCLWALSTHRAQQVWVVPTFEHAFGKQLVSFEHRVRMCELAFEGFAAEQTRVCEIEAELGTPSRTLTTVQALQQRFPQRRFSLLVGADILAQKRQWYRFDELERLVEIVAVGRAGEQQTTVAVTLPDISSSEIRRRLAAGQNVADVVPAAVLQYIHQQQLYAG